MEQGHVCKICSKICVSGKSLGGHMRVHIALISASKKAAKGKFEGKMELEDCDNQSNSTSLIKKSNGEMNFEDVDLKNSYELRDNPKKSGRYSNPRNGISKKRHSCKECGKEFPTLRALSTHVRSHSINNGEVHNCEKCGKGFDSMRAMFGHMKSHSKKLRAYHDSGESLSDFELCLVRRKRSRIKYGDPANIYGSSLNASSLGEVEDAAVCLMMLSTGVRDWNQIDSVNKFDDDDDDDDLYFGGESSCRSTKIDEKIEGFVSVSDEILKMRGSIEKKVDEFDDLDSSFAADNEMKVVFEVSHKGLLSVENKSNGDKLKDLLKTNESKSNHFSDFGKSSCKNVADDLEIEQKSEEVRIMTNLESNKSKKHECPNEKTTMNQETGEMYNDFDLNIPISVDDSTKGDLGVNMLWVESGLDR